MKTAVTEDRNTQLKNLCSAVQTLVHKGEYETCTRMICEAMEHYPHDPQPHNLMGIVLEHTGNHSQAMKHFRAAWALDPTYRPASQNLDNYGTFYSHGSCAYDESSCANAQTGSCEIPYHSHSMAHITRRK